MSQVMKPCPFCGSDHVESQEAERVDAISWVASVACLVCQVRIESIYCCNSPQEAKRAAIAAWNTRFASPAAPTPTSEAQEPAGYVAQDDRTGMYYSFWKERENVASWIQFQHLCRDDATYRLVALYTAPPAAEQPNKIVGVPRELLHSALFGTEQEASKAANELRALLGKESI